MSDLRSWYINTRSLGLGLGLENYGGIGLDNKVLFTSLVASLVVSGFPTQNQHYTHSVIGRSQKEPITYTVFANHDSHATAMPVVRSLYDSISQLLVWKMCWFFNRTCTRPTAMSAVTGSTALPGETEWHLLHCVSKTSPFVYLS